MAIELTPDYLNTLTPDTLVLQFASSYNGTSQYSTLWVDAVSFSYTPPAPLSVSIYSSADTICYGGTWAFDAQVTGGYSPYTYSWSSSGDSVACNTCAEARVNYFTQNSAYTVTVTDLIGSTATATLNL